MATMDLFDAVARGWLAGGEFFLLLFGLLLEIDEARKERRGYPPGWTVLGAVRKCALGASLACWLCAFARCCAWLA